MQLYGVYFGAALLLALLASLPALAHKQHWSVIREDWRYPLRLLFGVLHEELGVVVVTYTWPLTAANQLPTVTAPTAGQVSCCPVQTAQVFFADTDAQAVVVHNRQLLASFGAALYPLVVISKSLGGASDSSFQANFTFGKTNTNSVTINKIGVGVGSGGTYDVALIFGYGPWLK